MRTVLFIFFVDFVDNVIDFLGLFFIIPCIDSYTKVDMRTVSFDVPPQEVLFYISTCTVDETVLSWLLPVFICLQVLLMKQCGCHGYCQSL